MERLELNESFGTVATLTFDNKIIKTGEDKEHRIIPWVRPLLSFDVSKSVLDSSELANLISFFQSKRGQSGYFRFKDYTDYKCTHWNLNTELGLITMGRLSPIPDGIIAQFQVNKLYYLIDSDTGYWRPITRIDNRFPIEIYIDNVLTSNYSINLDTGVVTFTNPPSANSTITISCEFEIWCRFGQDELNYTLLTGENEDTLLYGIDSLKIVESRENAYHSYGAGYKKHHAHELSISMSLDQTGGDTYTTLITDLSSGFSREDFTRTNSLKSFKTGERYLNNIEITYLIGLYRILRGSGSTFNIENYSGNYRFNSNLSILIETIDLNRDEYIYLCQSNDFVEVIEIDTNLSIIGQNAVVNTTYNYKDPMYWGFTAANGAATTNVYIYNPVFNGNNLSPNFTLVGTAQNTSGNNFKLVNQGNPEVRGAVWSSAIDLSNSTFSVSFNFTVDGFDEDDFDGFVFAFQSQGQNVVQSSIEGGGLGYMSIAPSIAVEIDGYRNSWDSSQNNHVGINTNGNLSSLVWETIPDSQINKSGNSYSGYCWVDYNGGTLSVFLAKNGTKPSSPTLTYPISFNDYFPRIESTTVTYEQGDATEVGMGIYTIAHCWKIERKDGVTICLTNHDSNLYIDGLTYSPLAAPEITSLSFSTALNVDNTEMTSILSSEFINEQDILGGKFDYASVTIFLFDYALYTTIKTLVSGYIGEITTTNRIFTAEVRGYAQHLQKKQLKITTKTCPLIFGEQGENKCNKDLTGLIETTTITEVSGQQKFKIGSGHINDFYTGGVVEWLSGKNQGIRMDIALYKNNEVTVWESLPYAIEVGDQVKMTAGCNKTLDTCISFGNIGNFGGDPFLPGNDYYLAGVLNIK